MIDLHPTPEARHDCPACGVQLAPVDWYVPGMRNLAELECPDCGTTYYGDMPAGHGIFYPALLDAESGRVYGRSTGGWFADFLEAGYANRSDHSVEFDVETRDTVSNPVLVNALDMNYVHSVHKLLHVQYYLDAHPDRDVIAMVPSFLTWMVPDAVDEVWAVGQSLSEGQSWNDWLAREVKLRVAEYEDCKLSVMFPHTNHADFDIERFTGVEPFPVSEWESRLGAQPTVTFVWRDVPSYGSVSRLWCSIPDSSEPYRRVRGYANLLAEKLGTHELGFREQKKNVLTAARELESTFPDIDIAVAGVGDPGGLPNWISDLRYPQPNVEEERALCRRYADSHLVIGTHGSHMSLPSAHAGAVLDIMPPWKRGNMGGDLLLREDGQRETMLRYRHVPANVSATEVARKASHMLVDWPLRKIRMSREYCTHEMDTEQLYEIRDLEERYSELIERVADDPRSTIGSDVTRGIYERLSGLLE